MATIHFNARITLDEHDADLIVIMLKAYAEKRKAEAAATDDWAQSECHYMGMNDAIGAAEMIQRKLDNQVERAERILNDILCD